MRLMEEYHCEATPYGKEYDPERIVKDIKEEIKNEMVGKYYAVIRIDRF